jgi:hypothetical protein
MRNMLNVQLSDPVERYPELAPEFGKNWIMLSNAVEVRNGEIRSSMSQELSLMLENILKTDVRETADRNSC